MNIEEKKEIIRGERSAGNKHFLVKYSDGRTIKKRLFVGASGNICEYAPGARRRGYYLDLSEIVDIRATSVAKCPAWKIAERNRRRAIAYLAASRLNPKLRAELEAVGEITEAHGVDSCSLAYLYSEKAIKAPDYTTSGSKADWRERDLTEKIKALTPFRESWRGRSYDISMSIQADGSAFYSEEYRNCGNGHYFLLLDARHAIHLEDD